MNLLRSVRTGLRALLGAATVFGLAAMVARASTGAIPAPRRVRIVVVEPRSVPEWADCQGVVRAGNSVEVIALVAGRIESVHVKAGQRVRKGEVLAELEPADFRARLESAVAGVAAADAALAEAKSRRDRARELFARKDISAQQMDETEARWKGAEAAVGIAKAALESARTSLGYASVRSPMDGIIVDKRVNAGDFTSPGLPLVGTPPGRSLMTVYDPGSLWMEAGIPERHSARVVVGNPARIVLKPAGLVLDGRFVEVLPEIEGSGRTFLARVGLPAGPGIKLGMTGSIRFAVGERKAIEVPESAIVERGQLDEVFVSENGRARLRVVRTGRNDAGNVEVLSGLGAGDRLIVDPGESLRDGDPVGEEAPRP